MERVGRNRAHRMINRGISDLKKQILKVIARISYAEVLEEKNRAVIYGWVGQL